MAETAVRSFVLEECAQGASLAYVDRAARRGFPHFLLSVDRRGLDPTTHADVPTVCVSSAPMADLSREWSTVRHQQDPLRRMAACGDFDSYVSEPLVWENDCGHLSISDMPEIMTLTTAECETLKWSYSCGLCTGINIRVPSPNKSYSVTASFYSDRSRSQLVDLQDTVAIFYYFSQMIYAELKGFLQLESANSGIRLSPREVECLNWVAKGKSAYEIAIIIGLSVETVRDHMKRVRGKLNASTRAQALLRASELGLIASHS